MLAQGGGALYMCFMGTKELRDYLADVNLLLRELWPEEPAAAAAGGAAAAAQVG